MWLDKILSRGLRIRAIEGGSQLPENPTLDDFKKESVRIAQLAKEIQNSDQRWSEEQWRKISKAIEELEDKIK